MKLPLTACIITKNEEAGLADCLNSLDFCSELVVVDSCSTDNTVPLAQAHGAKVLVQPFLGHIKQKQLALDQATQPWVLCIDADERVSQELKTSILQLFAPGEPRLAGYELSRLSFHLGRWIRHGGWYPDRGIRLARRNACCWGGYDPHDKLLVDGPTGRLEGDLLHYVFRDLSHNVDKNNFYSSIMARDLAAAGKNPSLLKLLVKPWGKFIECYLLKRGFLDGLPGLIIAVGAAYSMFLKFAKLWEIQRLQKKTPQP